MSEMITAHAGSKHLRIPQAFIHDKVREGLVKCEEASSDDNGADSYTKSPARQKFKKDMRESMGPSLGWSDDHSSYGGVLAYSRYRS